MQEKLIIGCDHAGFKLKEFLKRILSSEEYEIKDVGTYSEDSIDYPDIAHPLAKAIQEKEYDFGILICGTGNGVNMTANKYAGVRAALCWNKTIAELARLHNDANIISLPARFIDFNEALEAVKVFLTTDFEGGRHCRRVEKISQV